MADETSKSPMNSIAKCPSSDLQPTTQDPTEKLQNDKQRMKFGGSKQQDDRLSSPPKEKLSKTKEVRAAGACKTNDQESVADQKSSSSDSAISGVRSKIRALNAGLGDGDADDDDDADDPAIFTREMLLPDICATEDSSPAKLYVDQRCKGVVGCVVWDGALVLCEYMDVRFTLAPGFYMSGTAEVLELGAGTGVCGLRACALGANVTLTDVDENLALMRRNVRRNRRVLQTRCDVTRLRWDVVEDRQKVAGRSYDLILVAECLYYTSGVDPLLETLIELAEVPRAGRDGTEIWITYTEREGKQQLCARFMAKLALDFHVDEVDQRHWLGEEWRARDIHLFKATKLP